MKLRALWGAWQAIAKKISIIANTIIPSSVYLAVIAPIAMARKLFVI